MIKVKRIDDHGFKVSIRLNGRSTQYFTELEAIELRDKLIAVLSPIPPTPDLPALLKRCKEMLQEVSEQKAMVRAIEQYEDYTGGEPNLGTCKTLGKLKTIADNATALLSDIEKMEAEK